MSEQEEQETKVEFRGPGGCAWVLIALIVCVTLYNIAELYFAHHK